MADKNATRAQDHLQNAQRLSVVLNYHLRAAALEGVSAEIVIGAVHPEGASVAVPSVTVSG